MISAAVGPWRRNPHLRPDHRSLLERRQARQAALRRPQLLARPRPHVPVPLRALAEGSADVAISCYPNAGLPNPLAATGFDLGPPDMARFLGNFAKAGLINIAGGCCGNTPEHIAAIAQALEGNSSNPAPQPAPEVAA